MIKFRVEKIFFVILAICFISLLINSYLHTVFSYHYHSSYYDPQALRFPKINREFNLNSTLTIYSRCLCQKEVIQINKESSHYIITVTNVFNKNFKTTNSFFTYNVSIVDFEAMLFTCDLYKVLRRGPHQNVVSYSIRQDEDLKSFQNIYLLNVKNTVEKHYQNWIARIYYDKKQISSSDICSMECSSQEGIMDPHNNIDFCDISELPLDLRSKWDASFMPTNTRRWLPVGDGFVNIFISRDVDACTSDREISAVNDWINEKTLFHTIRDHYTHDSYITPGLWGFRTHENRGIAKGLFHIVVENSRSGNELLQKNVWPIFKLNSTVHDSYFCETMGGKPFPVRRSHLNCYVGMFGCCGSLLNKNVKIKECPEKCRPLQHRKEWTYC